RLAPTGAGYEHDDFARRFDIPTDEPVNGHPHCRQLLLTGFTTVLVEEGDLVLGRWQSVFAVELDGPRNRELAMQLDGEISSPLRGEVAPHQVFPRGPRALGARGKPGGGTRAGKTTDQALV